MKKKIIAVISAKKRSKRLPNKNILPIKGIPMFLFVANEIKKSKRIKDIIVSSDSNYIKKLTIENGFNFIKRPKRLTLDNTEKQEVVVHTVKTFYKNKKKPHIVLSIQPNSPEIKYTDLNKALNFFEKKLYPKSKIKELIAINKNKVQNPSFRILSYKAVFQKSLSTKIGVYFCDYIDIHNKKDYLNAKKIIEKKNYR